MNYVILHRISVLAVACAVLLRLTVASAVGQGAPPVAMDSPLDQDSRLDRQISFDETGIALKDLLRKMSAQNLTLTTDRFCQEQKLQLLIKRRPLYALMSSIAELLGGSWQITPDNKGYQFSQTDATLLRRRRWWSLLLGEREQALADLRAAILQNMRADLPQTEYSSTDKQDKGADIQRVNMAAAVSHNLFAQLPETLQDQFAQQIANDAYLSNTRLSDSGELIEGSLLLPIQDLPQSTQAAIAATMASLNSSSTPTYLRLRNSGMSLRAYFLDETGHELRNVVVGHGALFRNNPALLFDHHLLAQVVKQLGREASTTWRELVAFHNSTVWQNDPVQKPNIRPPAPPHRSEILSWLASKGNFEFVADYYSTPFTSWSRDEPLQRPIKTELDFRAAEQDMSWKRRTDNIVMFRNNRWYRDDNLEVPNDMLARWSARQAEIDQTSPKLANGAPRPVNYAKRVLDLRVEVVSTLTPWQIQNGFKNAVMAVPSVGSNELQPAVGKAAGAGVPAASGMSKFQLPFWNLAELLNEDPETLRFYADLSDEQRAALLRGTLPYSSLAEPAQKLVQYIQPMVSIRLRQAAQLQVDTPIMLDRLVCKICKTGVHRATPSRHADHA